MKQICIAACSEEPSEDAKRKAFEVIDNLWSMCRDSVIFVGGYWGLMRYVVDRALEKGFTVVIFAPLTEENTLFPEKAIVIRPGVDYRVRSVFMVRSCNALIALGGESGTIQEIVTAYAEGKPVYLLKSGYSSDKIALLAPHLDKRALAEIKVFEDPKKLVEELAKDICRK